MNDGSRNWFLAEQSTRGVGAVSHSVGARVFVDAEAYYADLRSEVEKLTAGAHICWIGFDAGYYNPNAGDFIGRTPMPARPPASVPKPFPRRAWQGDDVSWLELLRSAADRAVRVRALLDVTPTPFPHDGYKAHDVLVSAELNKLRTDLHRNVCAIDDFRYLWMNGTHHQKLVVLVPSGGPAVAYVGTADIQVQRIEDRWCEVQCRVDAGMTVAHLYNVFYTRWIEHTAVRDRVGAAAWTVPDPAALSRGTAGSTRFDAQVCTTYGNPKRATPPPLLIPGVTPRTQVVNEPHRVRLSPPTGAVASPLRLLFAPLTTAPAAKLLEVGNDFFTEKAPGAADAIADARKQAGTYASPRDNGHTGIYIALTYAIAQTQEFIYLEDQYLVCDLTMGGGALPAMVDVLAAKVGQSQFQKLIILCTRIADIEAQFKHQAWSHRRAFLSRLLAADPAGTKVTVCQYRSRRDLGAPVPSGADAAGAPWYVHSKTWVFDDQLLAVGSANCNRRGYSHDSELELVLHDPDGTAVRDARKALWLQRLNTQGITTPVTASEIDNAVVGAGVWEDPVKRGLTIENNRTVAPSVFVPSGLPPIPGLWDVVIDPDGM